MPCWVAPIVAAELWGVTPGHVLGAIADGSLPSRQEYGFVLVDVAPEGACPQPRRQEPPPPTYTVVSYDDAGVESLAAGAAWSGPTPVPEIAAEPESAPQPHPEPHPLIAPPVADDAVDPELPPLDEEEDDVPISNWRQVRSNMGRMRKPPTRTPPPAAFAA